VPARLGPGQREGQYDIDYNLPHSPLPYQGDLTIGRGNPGADYETLFQSPRSRLGFGYRYQYPFEQTDFCGPGKQMGGPDNAAGRMVLGTHPEDTPAADIHGLLIS
jgi:hypothetical protein